MADATANSGSWSAFLKSIASFNGDLSSLTAPPFILSSQSLTEFSSYWATHPPIFTAAAAESDPAKRAMLVLKWFLSTLKHQYASRSEQFGNEKKPLNPFLGELFLGSWNDEAGKTTLISEQVSHHPPATAYCIRNDKTGVQLEGYNAQKASFKSTIIVKQIGHAVLTIPVGGSPDSTQLERYLITLPSLHIEGLIFGAPFVELDGSTTITSSSGYSAKIDYSGKGWLSGKKNTVIATVFPTDNEKEVLYNVTGQWTKEFEIYQGPAKKNSKTTLVSVYDAAATSQSELRLEPLEKQHPLESRRAWSKVAEAIQKSDMDAVSVEKSKIEQAQRLMRQKETAGNHTWERRYFTAATEDETLALLGKAAGVPLDGDKDKTGGLWRFDAAKAAKADAEQLSNEQILQLEDELLGQTA
ncbi:hypothetical protein ACQKWADRAFT_302314 [Trichoderma austrokoningii]